MLHSLSRRLRGVSLMHGIFAFKSLRWRLTGWFVLMLSGVLIAFSGSAYLAAREVLLDNFDDTLKHQAGLIAQAIAFEDGQPALARDVRLTIPHSDDYMTRLYRRDSTLVFADSRAAAELPAPTDALEQAWRGKDNLSRVQTEHETLRIATYPIVRGGKVVGALQVGVSMDDLEKTTRTLLKVLLVIASALLLVASGGGLFLANRALAPIDKLTRTAQRISAEDLSQRLDLRGPDDEVGRLALTFDAMLARLNTAFERQRRFAADASHELRTPLTAIIGQIDVTLDRPRDAEGYRTALATVREQAQRLARLSNDLLFLARSDAGPAPGASELVELGTLLPAIVAQVEPLAQARQHMISFEQTAPLLVRGNEDDLIRMFLNLLDNAIRYTPPGGRIIVAGSSAADQQLRIAGYPATRLPIRHSQPAILVCVRDSGPGIAPEHLPRLFDRFFRIDRGRNRAQGGSGLGLAIAQSIAQQHGGRLLVESTVGAGTTFTAILPQAAPVV
jgi:signal transduction histidine kinase